MYLVDTNVISIAAPSRAAAPSDLVGWMDAHSNILYISAITVAEIQSGIAKARRDGATGRADALAAWLRTLLHLYGERVLPLNVDVALGAGTLSDKARALGRPPGLADIILAATAAHHQLVLLTRNVKHFAPLGVALHDPYASLPT